MQYTQAQIDLANAVSLEDFLRTQGETLIKSGREYRWKEHDSLTVRGNKWFRHSQSKGGYTQPDGCGNLAQRQSFASSIAAQGFEIARAETSSHSQHRKVFSETLPFLPFLAAYTMRGGKHTASSMKKSFRHTQQTADSCPLKSRKGNFLEAAPPNSQKNCPL